jgi:hypothetical protein
MIGGGAASLASLGVDIGRAKSEGISTNIPSNSGATATGMGLHKFSWQLLSMRYFDANSCDDYMSKEGYAFLGFGVPAFTYRTSWDYVKTNGASFASAPIPTDAQRDIIAKLDAGLRLWKGNYLGDYSRSNAIIT